MHSGIHTIALQYNTQCALNHYNSFDGEITIHQITKLYSKCSIVIKLQNRNLTRQQQSWSLKFPDYNSINLFNQQWTVDSPSAVQISTATKLPKLPTRPALSVKS